MLTVSVRGLVMVINIGVDFVIGDVAYSVLEKRYRFGIPHKRTVFDGRFPVLDG